ncbi:MAG: cytochrome c peroxidase [Saprospiraceae bacterium]|jgi:cytochrome c peroxidase
MKNTKLKLLGLFLLFFVLISGTIDLDDLFNYSDSSIPDGIDSGIDSAPFDNLMDDKIATLGRVLFYDKKLSSDNSVSCASCHKQELAFGVEELQGTGVNGLSLRRPMRLLNLRILETPFERLFWDSRAGSLEELAAQPIKDHIEMGYSGFGDGPDFNDLILQLEGVDYYDELFIFAFGDNAITEVKISKALAQFVRSIESYDSRFDAGFELIDGTPSNGNIELDFPNFSPEENSGKILFISEAIKDVNGARVGGGVGCFHCHSVPSFTYSSESGNNGVILEIDGSEVLGITKAPSLRDVFGPSGSLNGPLFHNGQASTFNELLNHYNNVSSANDMLDLRLEPNGIPLNLTSDERLQLEAFIKTLTGIDIYTNKKWSNPFDINDEIEIIGGTVMNTFAIDNRNNIMVYPNPAETFIRIEGLNEGTYYGEIYSLDGQKKWQGIFHSEKEINISTFPKGLYSVSLFNNSKHLISKNKFIKL